MRWRGSQSWATLRRMSHGKNEEAFKQGSSMMKFSVPNSHEEWLRRGWEYENAFLLSVFHLFVCFFFLGKNPSRTKTSVLMLQTFAF